MGFASLYPSYELRADHPIAKISRGLRQFRAAAASSDEVAKQSDLTTYFVNRGLDGADGGDAAG